jgi:hypothetical protein
LKEECDVKGEETLLPPTPVDYGTMYEIIKTLRGHSSANPLREKLEKLMPKPEVLLADDLKRDLIAATDGVVHEMGVTDELTVRILRTVTKHMLVALDSHRNTSIAWSAFSSTIDRAIRRTEEVPDAEPAYEYAEEEAEPYEPTPAPY